MRPDVGIEVCRHPTRNVFHRVILKRPAANAANTDEPAVAVEHADPRIAEVGQDRRLIAVQAEHRRSFPPRRLQSRPRDAIVLDVFPGVSRPSSRCSRPIVGLPLEPPRPFIQIELQREVVGEPVAEKIIVPVLRGCDFLLSILHDNFDIIPGQPLRLKPGPEIGNPLLAPMMQDDTA